MKEIKFKIFIAVLLLFSILGQVLPLKLIAADYADISGWVEIYETVEDYLKVYYEGYEYVEKSEITAICLDSLDRCTIKDFSGIYDYPNLTFLDFWGFEINLNLDLSKLPKLKNLTISMGNIQGIECSEEKSMENLSFFYSEIPQCNLSKLTLKELHMEYCVGEVIKNIGKLEELRIERHYLNQNSTLDFSSFNDLKVLKVSVEWDSCSYTIAGLDKLENLKELSLYDANYEDNVLKNTLKNLPKLEVLELGSNTIGETKNISKLGIESLENLKGLVLDNVSCEDNILSNLSNLRVLGLRDICDLDGETRKDISNLQINRLENLEELSLNDVIINENNILSNLSNLRVLNLGGILENDGVTSRDISNLQINRLENLQELILAGVIIKENNILSNLSNLTILNLSMVFEDDGKTLKDISKLEIDKLEKLQEFCGDFVYIR